MAFERTIESVPEALMQTGYIARQDAHAQEDNLPTFTQLYAMSQSADPESRVRWDEMVREARQQDCPRVASSEVARGVWGEDPSVGCISGIERAATKVDAMRDAQDEAVHDVVLVVRNTLGVPALLLMTLILALWIARPFFKNRNP